LFCGPGGGEGPPPRGGGAWGGFGEAFSIYTYPPVNQMVTMVFAELVTLAY